MYRDDFDNDFEYAAYCLKQGFYKSGENNWSISFALALQALNKISQITNLCNEYCAEFSHPEILKWIDDNNILSIDSIENEKNEHVINLAEELKKLGINKEEN